MSNSVFYLCGPMQGFPEHNHPAFHEAAARLRHLGYSIISPAEYGNLVTGWQECMKRDTHALLWCSAVVVLPGWENSRGATFEANVACDLDMPVYELDALYTSNGQLPEQIPLHRIKLAYYMKHISSYVAIEAVF